MEEYVYVTDAQHLWGTVLNLEFSSGVKAVVDLATVLRGPAYERVLSDDSYFARFELDDDIGSIVWPDGVDVSPDTLLAAAALRSDRASSAAASKQSSSIRRWLSQVPSPDHMQLLGAHDYASHSNLWIHVASGGAAPSVIPDVTFIAQPFSANHRYVPNSVHVENERSWSETDDAAFRSYAVPD